MESIVEILLASTMVSTARFEEAWSATASSYLRICEQTAGASTGFILVAYDILIRSEILWQMTGNDTGKEAFQ